MIGKWTICTVNFLQADGRWMSMTNNVCPTIDFVKGHSGYLKSGDSTISAFNWTSDGDRLVIAKSIEKSSRKIFNLNGSLKIIHKNRKEFREVDLLDNSRHIQYVLVR